MRTSSAAITAIALSKTYRSGVAALAGVDLQAQYGEVVALLGRNGSGKTTTVRILTTLTRPTGGTASVAGHDVVAEPAEVRRRVGVTMQDAALDPAMTAREHLRFVAALGGLSAAAAWARADELLDQFGLAAAADRRSGTFSGGMCRRLDLASALATQPSVLFLDEPTTGLDAQSRRALWQQIRDLRAAGTAVLLTTQYLEEAEQLADQVAILHAGRILAHGSPAGLRGKRQTQLRFRLVEPNPSSAADSTRAALRPDDAGWISQPVPSSEAALTLLDQLRRRGAAVEAVRIDTPTLEDVYLQLTGHDVTAPQPTAA